MSGAGLFQIYLNEDDSISQAQLMGMVIEQEKPSRKFSSDTDIREEATAIICLGPMDISLSKKPRLSPTRMKEGYDGR